MMCLNQLCRASSVLGIAVCLLASTAQSDASELNMAVQEPPTDHEVAMVDEALIGGELALGSQTLSNYLDRNSDNDYIRFGLALNKFLLSGERFFQELYEHGFNAESRFAGMILPMARIPFPPNADPDEISNDDLRNMLERWQEDVADVEAILAEIDPDASDLKLRLKPGMVRMDFNQDGVADDREALWVMFAQMPFRFDVSEEGARDFEIAFDRGDVEWLRGYCHIVQAVVDVILAHDTEKLFEHTGHLFFERPDSEFEFPVPMGRDEWDRQEWEIVDLITFIHLMQFEVEDRGRMSDAREHLLAAVERSRTMWKMYDAETDNDREWVPRPGQDAAIPRAEITEDIRGTWLLFLDEAELVLNGDHLLRFWRATDQRGINLKRVFEEPREFDLILWIQGTAAYPYLEHGQLTTPGTWERLQTAMDGRFFRNAFWMN